MSDYKLVLSGFKTEQQVLDFMGWYEGAGEQDVPNWTNGTCMNVDVYTPYVWEDNSLHVALDVAEMDEDEYYE